MYIPLCKFTNMYIHGIYIRLGREQADSVQLSRGLKLNQETPRQELYECKIVLKNWRMKGDHY